VIKRILPLLAALALALGVAAPAALAEDGGGAGAQQTQRGDKAKAGKEKLRKAVEQARKACSKAKDSSDKPGKAHKHQCAKAAQRLLAALKQAEQRVQKLHEKLSQVAEQRCGTTTATGAAEKCDRLRQRLERLATLGTKLQAAIEKLESRIGKAGDSQATGTASQDVQVSSEEIESVEELAQELADSGN
jgi:small-conductance mechanosensitive channel